MARALERSRRASVVAAAGAEARDWRTSGPASGVRRALGLRRFMLSSLQAAGSGKLDLARISHDQTMRPRALLAGDDDRFLADQARLDSYRDILDPGALEDDGMLDLGVCDPHVLSDRREWPDIGIRDSRPRSDHQGAAQPGPLDHRAGCDPDRRLDRGAGIHLPFDPVLEVPQDDAIGFEQVLDPPGILPPAVDDVRAHALAARDQVLNRVGDLELPASTRPNRADRVEHRAIEQVNADQGQVAARLLRLLLEPDHAVTLQLRDSEFG